MSGTRAIIFCLAIFPTIIVYCNSFSFIDIVQNPNLVKNHLACIEGLKECSPMENKNKELFFKYAINNCQDCTPDERNKIQVLVWFLEKYYPTVYADLQNLASKLASSYQQY
ncbi:uncharacterized protein LOC127287699 [Leptopilina boulardi]|uniref:uncharacterized protein LOC127287699 n=1 Tax=Leptopilina boulardi TaxID=63433 RepID=UPI0021F567A5|nr:uncharacterized protein LOC127287699 [Leptopilina boulardi]